MKKKKQEMFLGAGNNLNVQTNHLVSLHDSLSVIDEYEIIELDVKIEADFSTIPEKYHEVFTNLMTAKYYGKVSFSDNPFSQCLPSKKKKWWEIWK